jgi:hypothetical protein
MIARARSMRACARPLRSVSRACACGALSAASCRARSPEPGGEAVEFRGQVGVADTAECGGDGMQAQTVFFQLLDGGDGVHGGGVVETESAAGAFRGMQQPELGVVVDGANADAGLCSEFADA